MLHHFISLVHIQDTELQDKIRNCLTTSLEMALASRLESSDYMFPLPFKNQLAELVTSFMYSECYSPNGTSTRGH